MGDGVPEAKRARTGTDAGGGCSDMAVATALVASKGVCGVDLKIGMRLEVRWSVIATEEEEGEDKPEGEAGADSAAKPAEEEKKAACGNVVGEVAGEGGVGGDAGDAVDTSALDTSTASHGICDQEEEDDFVWWGCHLDSLKSPTGPHGPVWVLKYDPMTVLFPVPLPTQICRSVATSCALWPHRAAAYGR